MTRLLTLLALIPIVATAAVTEDDYRALAAATDLTDEARLEKLFDLDWEYSMSTYPEFATYVGRPEFNDRWTDNSLEAIARRKQEARWPEIVLERIDPANLPPAARLSHDLFRRDLLQGLAWQNFPSETLVLNQLGGLQQDIPQVLEQMPTARAADYENILARLRQVPRQIDNDIALLRRGLDLGVTPPRIVLRAVPEQILAVIPDNPEDSPLLEPFAEFPDSIPAADQDRLRSESTTIYDEQLVPAFRKLHTFVNDTYLPGAREAVGWNTLPDGESWYALAARSRTTTDQTPREIHDLGLREVARIRAEMVTLIADTGFDGDFAAFTEFLRTDPQFYLTDPEKLVAAYRDIAKQIDPELPRLFGKLPRLPYGVKPIPGTATDSQPTAFYQGGSIAAGRPGWFLANTSNLEARPTYEMECLTLHEAVPGHHLQIALAQEMEAVPKFRQHGHYTAFVEGWALYAESLGGELGLYTDPYSRFGALTFEMWRACRLVVDTGIHSLGWSRQRAIDYLRENTGKSEHDATVEIDRYIVWPGQALAYKIGELEIRRLRDHARESLGEKFDIRAFHDTVLSNGALPLAQLANVVDAWIVEQGAQ